MNTSIMDLSKLWRETTHAMTHKEIKARDVRQGGIQLLQEAFAVLHHRSAVVGVHDGVENDVCVLFN